MITSRNATKLCFEHQISGTFNNAYLSESQSRVVTWTMRHYPFLIPLQKNFLVPKNGASDTIAENSRLDCLLPTCWEHKNMFLDPPVVKIS